MPTSRATLVGMLILLGLGCGSKSGGGGKPFLDEKQEVPPRMEWNREIVSRNGGTISIRVQSQAPVSILLVAEKSYKALKDGKDKKFNRTDVLLDVPSTPTPYEGKATLPAGSFYFIIENQSDGKVQMHLQCYAGARGGS